MRPRRAKSGGDSMGDWIPMERKLRKKALSAIFLRYMICFAVGTAVLLVVFTAALNICVGAGMFFSADYAQRQLDDNLSAIRSSGSQVDSLIPAGCAYGIYKKDGTYVAGTFDETKRSEVWERYEADQSYGTARTFYKFIAQDDGNICIVRYYIMMQFKNETLRKTLPSPELMLVGLFVLCFFVYLVVLSVCFGRALSKRLKVLERVTEKIRENNLDFPQEHSDIREIDETLGSLYRMRCALKESLENQWIAEREKTEQVAALAHDIKTPLTIIRGNAELIEEGGTPEELGEYNGFVLQSVEEIEHYLVMLQDMLLSKKTDQGGTEVVSCRELAEKFISQTRLLAAAKKLEVVEEFELSRIHGEAGVHDGHILRAWNNIVSNAVEHSLTGKKLFLSMENTGGFFRASVTDEGEGFGEEELKHAAEQFYQGDKSRHSKEHRGMGLYIAGIFARQQGGELLLANSGEGKGAKVTLVIKVEEVS